jgi:hypothetical protein
MREDVKQEHFSTALREASIGGLSRFPPIHSFHKIRLTLLDSAILCGAGWGGRRALIETLPPIGRTLKFPRENIRATVACHSLRRVRV